MVVTVNKLSINLDFKALQNHKTIMASRLMQGLQAIANQNNLE